jgi:hypothetical protein
VNSATLPAKQADQRPGCGQLASTPILIVVALGTGIPASDRVKLATHAGKGPNT